VNESGHDFLVVDGNIRFGLDAVKNVGSAAVDAIVAAREEDGPFRSLWDVCRRVDVRAVTQTAIVALIKCGALDSTAATRSGLLAVLEQAQGAGQKQQQDALLGQGSIFDMEEPGPGGAGTSGQPELPIPALPDERPQLNAWEKETLGLFLSSHPLKEVRHALRRKVDCSIADLPDRKDQEWVTVGGIVTECKKIRTRKGDPMLFATLDDLEGQVEMLVFAKVYGENAEKVEVDRVITVRGRVDKKEAGEVKLVAQEVEIFEPSAEEVELAAAEAAAEPEVRRVGKRVTLEIAGEAPAALIDDLKQLVEGFPGEHELLLIVGKRQLKLGEGYRIRAEDTACRAELAALPGVSIAA
jgi:DNA polymerase-3 subunit alpha